MTMRMRTVLKTQLKKRPRSIPPAPRWRRGEGQVPDGWEILNDAFGDGADHVGTCLWMVLRDLQQWAETNHREGMFGNRSHASRARLIRAQRLAPGISSAL